MHATQKQVAISVFRNKIKELIQDPTSETIITRNGKPIGVFFGMSAWQARQETIYLIENNLKTLLDSLILHSRFQKTGEPEGISLEKFESLLK